jgi:hypothetical protein
MAEEKKLPVEKIVVSKEVVDRVAKGLAENARGGK